MYEQLDLFSITRQSIKITKPIRLIELFAGIGSQAMALKRLDVNFEHYKMIEIDKFAVKSYNAIHDTKFGITDITTVRGSDLGIIDTDKYTYLMTYSFPCQDLSVAGRRKGMTKGSGTRSGLLWEVERLLNETENLPQILLMENVPQVHGKKNLSDFEKWIEFLESKGYSNYWQDLNAKDYGVAQNRNRCFMISILGNYEYSFPSPKKLDKVMMDYLEESVDDKYYTNDTRANVLISELLEEGKLPANTVTAGLNFTKVDKVGLNIAKTLLARDGSGFSTGFCTQNAVIEYAPVEVKKLGNIYGFTGGNYAGNVYDKNYISPTINTATGGNRQPMVITDNHRIRKLTPRECGRLMAVSDEDISKMAAVNSNSQLYKQFGNSIVVDVMVAMFKNLNIKQK